MAFRTNRSQQLSFTDSASVLTEREQKALENSWAKIFAEDIFPAIDEERFRVLYSTRSQSKFNTPVNICVGALIIKELFQVSDDDIVESLMLDVRYQYALHTTSYNEQPLSDKSLSRFRKRCYDYEATHSVNLLHDCVTDLGKKIAKMMKVSPRIRRMDSMMIEANIKKLSRTELLYTCISKFVSYLHKNGYDTLLQGMEHYYNPNDFNRTFYYSDSSKTDDHLKVILEDADKLLDACGKDFDDVAEYQFLLRCLSEQTIVEDAVRRLKSKEDGGMDSSMMQNPTDPDATFRNKAGKEYRGYAANVDEAVGENGSVITDYQFEQNTYSDSQFLKDSFERNGVCDKESTLVTDGAYFGEENQRLAKQNNVKLVPTAITGVEVPDIYADFKLNETGSRVLECPAGYAPKSSSCSNNGNGHIYASFQKEQCLNCPHRNECRIKIHAKVCSITISAKGQFRAQIRRMMDTEEYKKLARIRNGVETVPSILRRIYHADRMPVRGCIPSRFFFGCKIAAFNFRKLVAFRKGWGNYAQNPILAV